MYKRVFFDRTLLVGLLFLSVGYILNLTWAGALAQAAALVIGVVWAYRASTTSPKLWFRLLSLLLLALIACLMALVFARVEAIF